MFISESNLAALIGISLATVQTWSRKNIYPSEINKEGIKGFEMDNLNEIPEIAEMNTSKWDEELEVVPAKDYNSIELFAGGGGLALGMEKAGFKHVLLNEFETSACNTLRVNRPEWNIIEGDVRHIDFTPLKGKIDFLSGGFPCQAFSFAGKQGGFNDVRGTLFFELARAVKEIQPKVFMGENVKGLVSHDNGRTFKTICNIIDELGYSLVPPRVLKAIMYKVPQKRERIILIAIRKDLVQYGHFLWPSPYKRVTTLRDAFYKGELYEMNVPVSEGASYPIKKRNVLALVPQGGDWRNLPEEVAKEYMGGSWLLGGGKTGMARRLSLEEPSLTLTCSPAQKQTERCHPLETRPLTVREYARIQTFPDEWMFQGTMCDKYKQIGNAVPVNLAWAVGRSIIRLLNEIEMNHPSLAEDCSEAVKEIMDKQSKLIVTKNRKTQTSVVNKDCMQLNLFDLFEEFSDNPIIDRAVLDKECAYGYYENACALVAYVKDNNVIPFEEQSADYYHSGQKFPASVALKDLVYLIPYVKGKGIKDVYKIERIRVGTKTGEVPDKYSKDLRLVFDIKYEGTLFEKYKKTSVDIFRTYRLTTIKELKELK